MLVEDDNNLREIYEARLVAEGYEIVSARDGEEALALAVKEKPDLIIADVMMPKISGFDMLDILRGTPETKNAKVIVMTALSQAEDKTRADKLGADRYLVKSQVTLEDVAKVARDVLAENKPKGQVTAIPGDMTPPAATPAPTAASEPPAPAAANDDPPAPTPTPITVVDEPPASTPADPPADPAKAADKAADEAKPADEAGANMAAQISSFMSVKDSSAPAADEPVVPEHEEGEPDGEAPDLDKAPPEASAAKPEENSEKVEPAPAKVTSGEKVIQPLSTDMSTPKVDLDKLMAQEEAKASEILATQPAANDEAPVPTHAPGATIDPNKIAL